MKRYLLLLLPFSISAQEKTSGINFSQNLTWEQIQKKAKEEDKYIFIDAFTTWCGPCKAMDKEIYTNESVGTYFNKNFISIKVQMDKTKNDKSEVKTWYLDADSIKKKYYISAFPTFLFLSPKGVLVNKEVGFKQGHELIAIGKEAKLPKRVYKDEVYAYNEFLNRYDSGFKNYSLMPSMYITAKKIRDTMHARAIKRDYIAYLSRINNKDLYSKENIEFLASITLSSDSKWFSFFYPEFSKVNKVMNDESYVQRIIDNIIQNEVANPLLGMSRVNKQPVLLNQKPKSDIAEGDWDLLRNKIKEKYNDYYTNRNVCLSKFIWYDRMNNYDSLIKSMLDFLDNYGINSNEKTKTEFINYYAYEVAFKYITDTVLLDRTIVWMKASLKKGPTEPSKSIESAFMDTYASLLYKDGQIKEAIKWEEKGMQLATEFKFMQEAEFYKKVLEKMRNGEKL